MSHVSSIELRKIRPELVSEKSVIESVVDLFHDVVEKVPQTRSTSSRTANTDQLEPIEWVRFLSHADEWHSSIRLDTLLLLIAYKSGLSLWTIESDGIANELFSIREHNVCSVCLLIPSSIQDNPYSTKGPLLAFAKSAGPPSLQIRSIKDDQQAVKIVSLFGRGSQAEPVWIESNKSVLICATHTFIIGYGLMKFEEKFFISNCYSPMPFALSTRWLAFVDHRLYPIHQSLGGTNSSVIDQNVSYTGAMLNAAKLVTRSVVKIGETVLNYGPAGMSSNSANAHEKNFSKTQQPLSSSTITTNGNINSARSQYASGKDELQSGIVTVVDVIKLFGLSVHDERQNWIIAHFQAHTEPIGYLEFNPAGHLLVTCDNGGHYFNVLEIQASPYRSTRANIKHLYTFFRGDTDCKVSHMTFTIDSRWLAVSTKRGTTHLFALNPHGGTANVRTHTTAHVVNRTNPYDRLTLSEDTINRQNNENAMKDASSNTFMNSIHNNGSNSTRSKRLNGECVLSTAITLIRQPTENFVSGLSAPFNIESLCLAATFGITRGFINPDDVIHHQEHLSRPCVSLFIISWHGRLIEYILDPTPDTTKYGARVTSETPISVKAVPKAQWALQKLNICPEVSMSTGYSYLSQGPRPMPTNKDNTNDNWLREVEIHTHLFPDRGLWMGPQFHFKHYSEATISMCQPNSNVLIAESPQTSINVVDADLTSLPIQLSKTSPVHIPNIQNNIGPAYIEFNSGSFQDAPKLKIGGVSVDSSAFDFEIELKEKLAEAVDDVLLNNVGNADRTSLLNTMASNDSTSVPSIQTNTSVDNSMPFPDTGDWKD